MIRNLSIVEVFKELYPENKIEEEINPYTKNKLYKTSSIFLEHNSKLSQLYFNEDNARGPGYFDFDSGQRGFVPDILRYKFDEYYLDFPKKSLSYLLNKFGLNLV